jgi:DegV family protein with EDD domain
MSEVFMSPISIITDTDASLPLALAGKYNIQQVPIIIQFGEESYRAVYDIDDAKTFNLIDKNGKLPTTSAPSPGQFTEAFKSAFTQGADSILCFTVSSEVSATYAAAMTARDEFPGRDITVIDTRSLSMGQGFQALYAAEAQLRGQTKEELISITESVRDRSHFFAALSTLKYLAMSGRVGQLAAGFGNLINIKPILTIQNGRLELLERIRTQNKAWDRLIELVITRAEGRPIERMAIVHVAAPEMARKFESKLRERMDCPSEILFCELTPGLSVHSGAGLVGVGFVMAE